MAFTLSGGPTITQNSSTSSIVLSLAGVDIGDTIVVAIWANSPLRSITSVTCTGESNLTVVNSYDLFGTQRVSFAYLVNATAAGVKSITVTLDGSVSLLTGRALAIKPPVGVENTVTFDAETDTTGSSTAGSLNITTTRDQSFVMAACVLGTGADPTFPGAGWTKYDTSALLLPVFYDLDTGVAGVKNVNWTQDNAFWAVGAAAFSHDAVGISATITEPAAAVDTVADADLLLFYTGVGGAEGTGTAPPTSTVGISASVVGTGGAEGTGTAPPTFASSLDFSYTGVGGAEGTGTAPSSFLATSFGDGSFRPLQAIGFGEASIDGVGRGYFEFLIALGEGVSPEAASGGGILEALTGVGYGQNSGAASFERMTAIGQATQGGIGIASFEPLKVVVELGIASFQPMVALGYGQEDLSGAYTIKVVNLRTGAVTEFTNHSYNSFARIGRDYYGAGPGGLVRLSGTTDPGNANIDWHLKTGQMDDKDPGLKRLPEVLLGLRSNNKITVDVYPDDNTSYSYKLPVVKKTTIHQHRVRPGKGMRSRWFAVGLRGSKNATLELDSMQVNMTETTRRLG